MATRQVVVIGGGIAGLAAALIDLGLALQRILHILRLELLVVRSRLGGIGIAHLKFSFPFQCMSAPIVHIFSVREPCRRLA